MAYNVPGWVKNKTVYVTFEYIPFVFIWVRVTFLQSAMMVSCLFSASQVMVESGDVTQNNPRAPENYYL